MMSIEAIRSESRRAARRSASQGLGPLVIERDDMDLSDEALFAHLRAIPFLGDRTPRGFQLVDCRKKEAWLGSKASSYRSLFVDQSGFGSDFEPALTIPEFVKAVRALGAGYAYSVEDAGPFQVNIRVMRRR